MPDLKPALCLIGAIFTFCFNSVTAQNLVNSTGSTISGNGYHVEYSIGEISIQTFETPEKRNFVTQGLLQPSVKVIQPDCEIVNDILQFFPNPTVNKIRIVGRNDWITHYVIYAADGKLMANAPFTNNYIDVTRFAAGVYILRLLPGCNGKFTTFKIVKKNL